MQVRRRPGASAVASAIFESVSNFIIWAPLPASTESISSFHVYYFCAQMTQHGLQRVNLGFGFHVYYPSTCARAVRVI